MKYLTALIPVIFMACSTHENQSSNSVTSSDTSQSQQLDTPQCPRGHTDSIVPIEYGFPSEEMFAQADSGLIVLGGCELGEFNFYCKKHEIEF